jgi:5-methylcytosine-specific restriction endonuclease McrA
MELKDKILKLKLEGLSYNQIRKELNCSLSTISYYCGEGQKQKSKERQRKNQKLLKSNLLAIFKRKKDGFSFVNNNRRGPKKRQPMDFTSKQFHDKLIDNPVCYLTGRKIDLYNPKTYHCDHIKPVSKGGSCNFSNLGLACKEANLAKSDLSVEEFTDLCKEVLINYGYKVEKIKMES